MVDVNTKKTLAQIPLLKTKAGPRDGELWVQRLKEEYQTLIQEYFPTVTNVVIVFNTRLSSFYKYVRWDIFISLLSDDYGNPSGVHKTMINNVATTVMEYVKNNKAADNDWFRLESNKEGTRWFGKCWYIHEMLKYEFNIEFDIPVVYPITAPEIAIPELDGKTEKMYRGGKICITDHFKPLWARNIPRFGIGHAMALGLGPWLAVEIPDLIQKGLIVYKEKDT